MEKKLQRVVAYGQTHATRIWRALATRSFQHNQSISSDAYVVHCNHPELNTSLGYAGNKTSTTKYTWYTFLPRSLFEQYRRAAYWYFTAMAAISLTPISPYRPITVILPLIFVIGLGMARELWEDLRRAQGDKEINLRSVVICSGGKCEEKLWKDVRVGDTVQIKNKEYFPADILILSSSGADGVCYVETKNLDGETNLKVRQALEYTWNFATPDDFKDFEAVVKCETPNASLYTYTGVLEFQNGQTYSLGPSQILLRDSSLQNTEHVFGIVIYAGHDTKVMQNAIPPPSKRSRLDRTLDKIMWGMFGILFTMSTITGISSGLITKDKIAGMYYLQPYNDNSYFNPNKSTTSGIIAFVTGVVLYGYLIPISLYVTLEIVRVIQGLFIAQDLLMYDEETNRPVKVKSSGLNEELGQVDTILADKTGTLTCNQMDFCRCTISGVSYGMGFTEVERAAERLGMSLVSTEETEVDQTQTQVVLPSGNGEEKITGFNFYDERLMKGNWRNEKDPEAIRLFFQILALCHTAIPEGDIANPSSIQYRAESPDETALVVAAKQFGFFFHKRTPSALHVRESAGKDQVTDRTYELLNVLEFSSARKRMSVIVRTTEGRILLLSKGADSIMLARLDHDTIGLTKATVHHLNHYGEAGLRTLLFAYKELTVDAYKEWQSRYSQAQNMLGPERTTQTEELADEMEKGLRIVGGTGVEDKLQQGVPECIAHLADAGIKVWVLTGDKVETAINIGYACSLLRPGMEKIIINLGRPLSETLGTEREKALENTIRDQLTEGLSLVEMSQSDQHEIQFNGKEHEVDGDELSDTRPLSFQRTKSYNYNEQGSQRSNGISSLSGSQRSLNDSFALVIDGDSLAFILMDGELQRQFLQLSMKCASVLCCRVSPKQKAQVTKLVRKGLGWNKLCLAIGDGANDVGMIQVANVGVGIVGVEGAQAAMAADYAIGKFRFLERLLLVHGHWCYRRIALMIRYFLYKVCLIGWVSFYSNIFSSFSGMPLYNDWYASFYSTVFTALPVGVVGVLDQDVSANNCLKFPQLYRSGQEGKLFNKHLIVLSLANSVYASLVIFMFPAALYYLSAMKSTGQPAALQDFGAALFTGLVLVPNLQLFTVVQHFTYFHHLTIWGSIASWFIFLLIYGSLPPTLSTQAYKEFVEVLAPSPSYWMMLLLVVITALLPDFIVRSFQWVFWPSDNQIVLESEREQTLAS